MRPPLSIFETSEANFLGKAAHACRCQATTVALKVTQLVFYEDFLVRPIDEFHVKNIKKLLQANPNSFADTVSARGGSRGLPNQGQLEP